MSEPNDTYDRDLGMHRGITRRDFLNGVAVTIGAAALRPNLLAAVMLGVDGEKDANYYPPALTGMRGSHPGSFEVAHKLRDGTFWDSAGPLSDTGEKYDLVIVGGGISGLAAAHFFRQTAGHSAHILILENHDDFGGHAKRNEFHPGRMLLGFGGTFAIESPAPYSAVAKGLIHELGIQMDRWEQVYQPQIYRSRGMQTAVFFDKETFASDRLVRYRAAGEEEAEGLFRSAPSAQFLADAPLGEQARKDLAALYQEPKDYLPGLTSDAKKAQLARISYADFLSKTARVHPDVVRLLQATPHGLFGLGIDAVSAQDAWGLGLPGFAGMKLAPGAGPGMNRDAIPNEEAEKYFFHFPDGNASIARLLVRQLVPAAIPGGTVDDLITSRASYARLDEADSAVRIRLNSTVVRVRHMGKTGSAKEVEVAYARAGRVFSARASHCILACWHMVIPYICDEFSEAQKEALADAAKVPIVYTNVQLRNWTAFQKLGVRSVYAPGGYHSAFSLDLPVSMGQYHFPQSPEEPIVVHMLRTPCKPGLPSREQHRAGRIELFSTSFAAFERRIRDQLGRALGGGGFDPARDITAITVNRWPHGYAYEYNSLFDKFWLEGTEPPCVLARKPLGRIAIANADADAYAYTDCAIDQAYRAVQEITTPA